MKKQSSIEWLVEEHFGCVQNCTPHFKRNIEIAIQKHKKEIEDAIKHGIIISKTKKIFINESEEYYNQTFKSE